MCGSQAVTNFTDNWLCLGLRKKERTFGANLKYRNESLLHCVLMKNSDVDVCVLVIGLRGSVSACGLTLLL